MPGSRSMDGHAPPTVPRGRTVRVGAITVLGLALCAVFVALGIWQVQRRAWKLELIARVDARVQAVAVPAPGPPEWPAVDARSFEYRHVTARGRYLFGKTAFVQATTERGRGFWAITPLIDTRGFVVLVNRGFVPPDAREAALTGPSGPVRVTGLLRLSEPGGGFLHENAPDRDRWYSRDVAAIAAARDLAGPVAPYFVDAELDGGRGPPVGGLTVIRFHNSHLVYAITWFALALLSLAASVYVVRSEFREGPEDRR